MRSVRPPSGPSGVSLLEVLASLSVTGAVVAVALGAFMTQRSAATSAEISRDMLDTGREALLSIERRLRHAGFGVDPRHAFDFRHFRCDGDVVSGTGGRDICRDRVHDADRISFLSRNPRYRIDLPGENGCTHPDGCPTGLAWHLLDRHLGSSPTLTLEARAGQRFLSGQVLLVSCSTVGRWTMATVRSSTDASAEGPLTLQLYATDPSTPVFENALVDTCFDTGARVFAVDRTHYTIADIDGSPWLVLDTGLDLDGDSNDPWHEPDPDDVIPVAPGVEDLQIAYVMDVRDGAPMPDSNENGVVGDDPSSAPEEPDGTHPAPDYDTPALSPLRGNLNPANIRAVRISLVVRSTLPDRGRPEGWVGDPLPQSENSQRVLSPEASGQFRRVRLQTTISVRNMASRSMFRN